MHDISVDMHRDGSGTGRHAIRHSDELYPGVSGSEGADDSVIGMVRGVGEGASRERGGDELIHVDVDIDKGIAHVEVKGTLDVIIADICSVLREVCKDGDIDPEWLIDILKATFLDGTKKVKEQEEDKDGLKYEAEADGDVIKEFLEKLILGAADKAMKEGAEDGIKDERSKEALPGTNRRYRRVRPH